MSRDPRPEQPVKPTELAHTPPPAPTTGSKLAAEGIGTFLLVFGLIGTALFASHLANVADPRTPVLHPTSTTHRRLSADQLAAAG